MKGKRKDKEKTKSKEPFSPERAPDPPQVINPNERPSENFTVSDDKDNTTKPVKK
jgi:hypothetical protein